MRQFHELLNYSFFRSPRDLFKLISVILKERETPSQGLTQSTQEQKEEGDKEPIKKEE